MDEHHGKGGSYTVDADGKKTQTEAPTAEHPEGNRPREADPPKPRQKQKPTEPTE